MAERARGQALVETAAVLPLVCIALVVTLQIIFSCRNAVLLQRMAFQKARDISGENQTAPAWLSGNPLWGRGAVPISQQSSAIPQPWRPFNAWPRVETQGHLVTVDMSSRLLPTGGFGQDLTALNQHATAEALTEPPVPEEE